MSDAESEQIQSSSEEERIEAVKPQIGRVAVSSTDLPEHLFTASSEALSEDQQERLIELLQRYESLFAANDTDLGHLSVVTHKINTGAARPVRQPMRRTLSWQYQYCV